MTDSHKILSFCRSVYEDKFFRKLFRLIVVALVAWLFFGCFCRPMFLQGESMMPTYPKRGFVFCWRPSFWFSRPDRGSVVVLSAAGDRIFLLKRVLAFEGETVECRAGQFIINGKELAEPYVKFRSKDWNIVPFRVKKGHIFVMGDNRQMPQRQHKGGEIRSSRLYGTPFIML